jgi:7-carboxy-7-deazaguanine synthase
MRIAEIFQSIQGEGFLSGIPSVFVRTSGCHLRCRFCDTPYAAWAPEGEHMSVDAIVRQVAGFSARHVVLTGGEPMLWKEMVSLTAHLRRLGRHLTIETSGTRYLPVECDLMSISPKLSNSTPWAAENPRWPLHHERHRHRPDVIRRLVQAYPYQIKFVIDTPADCLEVEEYLRQFPEIDRNRVLLMPQGTDRQTLAEKAQWLIPYCHQHQLHYCPRVHIELFGNVRGR